MELLAILLFGGLLFAGTVVAIVAFAVMGVKLAFHLLLIPFKILGGLAKVSVALIALPVLAIVACLAIVALPLLLVAVAGCCIVAAVIGVLWGGLHLIACF